MNMPMGFRSWAELECEKASYSKLDPPGLGSQYRLEPFLNISGRSLHVTLSEHRQSNLHDGVKAEAHPRHLPM